MSDDEIMAAELALGILDPPELVEARARAVRDPVFAAAVARWEELLAPLLDEVASVAPSADLWPRIARAIAGAGGGGADVLRLRRSVRRWQGLAGLAMAASVALVLLTVPPLLRDRQAPGTMPTPVAPRNGPVLIASLGDASKPGSAAVSFGSDTRDLVVSASALSVPAGRDAQLWIIPVGGKPISLGLVDVASPARRRLAPALANVFRAGATVALSIEPEGGSPTGGPTGAIVASGPLQAV